MDFCVIGGDGRFDHLRSLLKKDGHSLGRGGYIILPLPCGETLPEAEPGTVVLAGKAPEALRRHCEQKKLRLFDYFAREEFTLRNAYLTAEGAVGLLLGASPRALLGSRVTIYGFGRIGRALAERLLSFGAKVTVAARSPARRVEAEALGCAAVDFAARPQSDFVVNTVPARHVSAGEFPGAVCLELASPPYGFDPAEGVIMGSGLPGKCCPLSAAEAIRDTLYNILEEIV